MANTDTHIELVSIEDVKDSMHDLGILIEDNSTLNACEYRLLLTWLITCLIMSLIVFNMCLVYNISAEKLAESWYSYQAKNPKVGLVPSTGHLDLFQQNFLTKDYVRENDIVITTKPVASGDVQVNKYSEKKIENSIEETNENVVETKNKVDQASVAREAKNNVYSDDEDYEELLEMDFEETELEDPETKNLEMTEEDEYNIINERRILSSIGMKAVESDFTANDCKMTVTAVDESLHAKHPFTFLQFNQLDFSRIMDEEIQAAEKQYSEIANIEVCRLHEESGSGAYYVGRIVKEKSGQKLTNLSMQLMSRGHRRIQMNVDHLLIKSDDQNEDTNFSFFPGQIVCLKALNDGFLLKVQSVLDCKLPFNTKILDHKTDENSVVKEDEDMIIEELTQSIAKKIPDPDVQVVVASGPFNKPQSLPGIKKLLSYITDKKPHVIILIGPFVDARDQKQILESDDDQVFTDDFAKSIRTASPTTEVVMVSSQHDYSGFNVMPSPPLIVKSFASDPKVTSFPNPCFFRVNGVSFAVTSTDVVKHLVREEYSNQDGDKMKRIVKHVVSQKSMYPVFPPPLDTNVDFIKYNQLKMPEKPDVLIMPSDLNSFCIDVDDTLCLNPRRLTLGCIARMKLPPRTQCKEPFPFAESCSAQVFRL